MSRLCLGTAQFGMKYGISNKDGQTSLEEVQRILQTAADHELDLIDTAHLYGESEEILGKALSMTPGQDFRVITKTPQFGKATIEEGDAEQLRLAFEESLVKLGLPCLEALLIHRVDDLLAPGGEHLYEAMRKLKESGNLNKIGVSAYEPKQVENVLQRYAIDLVQIPMNILDQRFAESGVLSKLKHEDIEVHARSPFLQGLLLMDLEEIPIYFTPIYSLLQDLREFLDTAELSQAQGALGFLNQCTEVDAIVMGINNNEQLLKNLADITIVEGKEYDFSVFSCGEIGMINPSLWDIA